MVLPEALRHGIDPLQVSLKNVWNMATQLKLEDGVTSSTSEAAGGPKHETVLVAWPDGCCPCSEGNKRALRKRKERQVC